MKQQHSFTQDQLYSIAIYTHETVLTDLTGKSPRRFLVDPTQLKSILDLPEKSVTMTADPHLLTFSVDKVSEISLYYIPKKKEGWKITLRTDKGKPGQEIVCFLPAFVMSVSIDKKKRNVRDIKAWTYTGSGRPNKQTRFYEMPLPNFSLSSLCLGGGGSVLSPSNVSSREAGLEAIFNVTFNNHSALIGKKSLSFKKYHQKYKGRFPLRTLRPSICNFCV